MIDFAKQRKKLAKWNEKFLDEANLPPLYLQNGEALNRDQVRFLLYRMSLIKEIGSDVEAKQLINHIDKSKATPFATHILQAFLDDGAKANKKYLMVLAGLLGDEELLEYFKKLFTKLYEDNRLKMAQYLINTIAMIDSIKSLRYIDFISKKYKSKASLKNSANESLELYAKEQGMSLFELRDAIIPDFGFDGLTLTMEIEDKEYRIYIAHDFKLRYIDEDNKIKKTLPSKATKEQKEQIKTIQKEIREANKSQGDRLEYYMMIERKWKKEAWEAFYLGNPLIFVYTSTLLWGLYDSDGNLTRLFYVDEDSAMLDIDDDDIEIGNNQSIGIIHPLRLNQEEQEAWSEKFYELELAQPFAQLHRQIYTLSDEDANKSAILEYKGKELKKSPTAIKNYLEKRGWQKEVVDGGAVIFYQEFNDIDLGIELGLEGLWVSYYEDEEAQLYETTFYRPSNRQAKVTLKEIPDIIYSELISDLEAMVRG